MDVDYLIVGQGLAGSALAMALVERGRSVLVVDRGDLDSASRVAAGLVTPLAGKGMNPAWRQGEYLPAALGYYRGLEARSGRRLFYEMPVLRLFSGERERAKFAKKAEDVAEWVGAREADMEGVRGEYGGFEMCGGGRLDTVAYLEVVREVLGEGGFLEGAVEEEDLVFEEGMVRWGDVVAGKVIFCRGFWGLGRGLFEPLGHRSAKGEMLTVQSAELEEGRILNRNGWMASVGGGLWRCGATYEREDLLGGVSEEGRAEVEEKIRGLVDVDFEVVAHESGVRPILRHSQPMVGLHPERDEVGFFNGLGSKGVITAPSVGEHFAGYLCGEWEMDGELDVRYQV